MYLKCELAPQFLCGVITVVQYCSTAANDVLQEERGHTLLTTHPPWSCTQTQTMVW